MKYAVLLYFILLPVLAGSSSEERYPNSFDIGTNDIEVITSIPKGLPLSKDNIRCHIPNCSGFGYRFHPILKKRKLHKGVDFPAQLGTPIHSTCYGIVSRVSYSRSGYGNLLEVTSGEYTVRYAHCNEILVKKGDRVVQGQVIATVGSSGLSTAPHCHYEVIEGSEHIDPLKFM